MCTESRMTCAVFLWLVLSGFPASAQDPPRPSLYTFTDVMTLAEQANPSAATWSANLEAMDGARRAATAFPNPEISLQIGRAESSDGSQQGREREWTISQTLGWPGIRAQRRDAALARVSVAGYESREFRLDLAARVKEAFAGVLLAERTLRVLEADVETARRVADAADLRVQAGEAPELERLKARVEWLKVTKDARGSGRRVAIEKAALNALAGGRLGGLFDLSGELPNPERSVDLADLIERALDHHPAILIRQRALDAARADLSRQRQSRIPDLTVFGGVSDELDKRSSSIGLAASIPLLDQRQGEIAEARAEQRRAEADLAQTRNDLLRQVTQAYQQYRIAVDQLALFEQGLMEEADEALRLATLSYEQGELDLLELLDAQRVQRATLIEHYQAQFGLHLASAQLDRVTGGLP